MKVRRTAFPDPSVVRKLVSESADVIAEGANVVDADLKGPTGMDMLLVDGNGRPVLVDISIGEAADIPARLFEHLEWLKQNRRLFLRAYAQQGVVRVEEPIFTFVAERFPPGVRRVLSAVGTVRTRLLRADYIVVDGAGALLLSDEEQDFSTYTAGAAPKRTGDTALSAGARAGLFRGAEIELEPVRQLLELFRSGVTGLDARITTKEGNGGIALGFNGRTLAVVSLSPGSFTVATGDPLVSPIVVSDRVSVERALNAVISMFVREEQPGPYDVAPGPASAEFDDRERAELDGIWGLGPDTKE